MTASDLVALEQRIVRERQFLSFPDAAGSGGRRARL